MLDKKTSLCQKSDIDTKGLKMNIIQMAIRIVIAISVIIGSMLFQYMPLYLMFVTIMGIIMVIVPYIIFGFKGALVMPLDEETS